MPTSHLVDLSTEGDGLDPDVTGRRDGEGTHPVLAAAASSVLLVST